jgi:hypothetical protein
MRFRPNPLLDLYYCRALYFSGQIKQAAARLEAVEARQKRMKPNRLLRCKSHSLLRAYLAG